MILLALVAMTAGCGGESEAIEPTTRGVLSVDQGASDHTVAATDVEPTPPEVPIFEPSSVQLKVVTKQAMGGQLQAFIVARGTPGDQLRQASDCVSHFIRRSPQKAIYCWAFPSKRAYRFAKVNPSDGGMKKICWSARASVDFNGDPDVAQENLIALADGCPDVPE